MATADQIKALLKSQADGDNERFYATALQVAAHAARQGHGNLAQELRALVDAARAIPPVTRIPSAPALVAQPRGELAGILAASYPRVRFAEMVLDDVARRQLDRVLREQRKADRLREHGLRPRNRVLLVGPPGSGKTMTASALAGELQLPLLTVQFDGLITKFMGETAAKLRMVFDAIEKTRGVYLFDEFDAIGGRRTAGNDVGEIRRVLNSFLQLLEQEQSTSVIVAATNHPELLDGALFRRFDDVVTYGLPDASMVERVVRRRLGAFELGGVGWMAVTEAAVGLSCAEVVGACDDVAKGAVLDEREHVGAEELVEALRERSTKARV